MPRDDVVMAREEWDRYVPPDADTAAVRLAFLKGEGTITTAQRAAWVAQIEGRS